jgi:hypothetical protein
MSWHIPNHAIRALDAPPFWEDSQKMQDFVEKIAKTP